MKDASSMGMVSADAHVNEPRDLWSANLPAEWRDRAMRGIAEKDDGGWELIFEGRHMGPVGDSDDDRLAVNSPEHRLAVMREEGIVGECIFPTIGLYVWMLEDPEGGRLSCRIYNDWIADQLESRSPRFRCAGLIPTWQVADAVAEVAHVSDLGLGAVMIPTVGPTPYNDRVWEPLWSAIEETGLPVVMHQGTGHDMIFYRGPGATVANLVATQSLGPRTATMLATSGVLARHPGLQVVFVEYNAGWLAWTMSTADYYTTAFSPLTTETQGSAKLARHDGPPRSVIYPTLDEPPSAYLRRQVHATFQDDPVAVHNVALTGPGGLLWGSDYPHNEGTYPQSRQTVERLAAGLADSEARRIFKETAIELFHFDPEALAAPI